MERLLHIENLSASYSKRFDVLSKVNISLAKGEIIAVIGENGSGKSTLLKSICGLLNYSTGSIRLQNKEIKDWDKKEMSKILSYVSSSEKVNSMILVDEFVGFGRYPYSNWLAKLSEQDEMHIDDALIACGVAYLKNKMMGQLSDGENQKVYLARAIAQQTPFIILDEPTTHLDIKSSNAIFKLLRNQKTENRSILFSSHQVEKALQIADKVWLVDCGRVIETTPKEFLGNDELKQLVFGEE
ncbi:MAG: ABC transporter ATP-binding protein [Flavobacteriales bacterium]|nr:ABC transporter ATP-binding protein [Flavobacteriales bacterium]